MSVKAPLADMVKALALELEAGWRLRADAADGLASHSCGRDLSREVGRILRNSLSIGEVMEKGDRGAPNMSAALRAIAGNGVGTGRNPQLMVDIALSALQTPEAS